MILSFAARINNNHYLEKHVFLNRFLQVFRVMPPSVRCFETFQHEALCFEVHFSQHALMLFTTIIEANIFATDNRS